jgi:hypothetical protein
MVITPSFQVGDGGSIPLICSIGPLSSAGQSAKFVISMSLVRFRQGAQKFLFMSMFIAYYLICVIYCFYQLFKNLSKRYSDDPTGGSPELDTIMVIMMAWVLAPVDVSLTWIRWYKDAEMARRRQERIL